MRRFITSLTGKVISHLVIVSLLASVMATTVASRAVAQVQMLPLWAVTEFTVHNGLSQTYGQVAAKAINSELSGSAKYQMISPEQVETHIKGLGLASPLQGATNLLRVGQDLRASTIVTGDVIAAQISSVGGGKQARVAIRAVAYDTDSGLPINGSAVEGDSTVRSGSITDDELIRDAIRAGANSAIREFGQHQLPSATVLNTLTDRCYFNAGTRAGFTGGQQVVINRGREEVATGHVSDLQPDEAVIVIERSYLGVAPGDHVRAVFPVPDIDFDAPFAKAGSTQLHANRSSHGGNNAGLISLLVVVGLIGVLLGNGGNTNTVLNSVTAQAALYPPPQGTIPSALISWSPNAYAKGNSQLFAWQVYRSDFPNTPVAVATGSARNVYDQQSTSGFSNQYLYWTYLGGLIGGTTCTYTAGNNQTITTTQVPSLVPGTPYIYQVELIYDLSSIDLPIISSSSTGGTASSTGSTASSSGSTANSTGLSGGSSGTTGGTGGVTTGSTGGSTTGTTSSSTGSTASSTGSTASTGGTSTSSASICYFASQKQSSGVATPLNQPVITYPTPGLPIAANAAGTVFQWLGSARQIAIQVQYVLQFSTSPAFPNSSAQTYTYPNVVRTFGSGGSSGSTVTPGGAPLSVFGTSSFLPSQFQSASTVYFRIGARATADSPGPVPDPQTGQRYIFSNVSYFTQQGTVPNPPAARHTLKPGHKA